MWLGLCALPAWATPNFNGLEPTVRELSALQDRSLGTSGNTRAAQLIAQRLKRLHPDTSGVQEFLVPARQHHGSSLFDIQSEKTLALTALQVNAISPQTLPSQGIVAPLVYGGNGELSSLDGRPIKDCVVLLELDSAKNWTNAAMLGAKAVIFLDPGPRRNGIFKEKQELTPFDLPTFLMPREAAEKAWPKFARHTADREHPLTEVRLSCDIQWQRTKGQNIYALFEGGDPKLKEQLIIVQAAYDAGFYAYGRSPGADQGLSVAAMLEMAETVAANRPKRSVLFVATAGSGYAQAGMREFISTIRSKFTRLKDTQRSEKKRLKTARAVLETLNKGIDPATISTPEAREVRTALHDEIKNRIDRLSTQLMRLRLKGTPGNAMEIERLDEFRLKLRKLVWNETLSNLSQRELDLVDCFLGPARQRQQDIMADAKLQAKVVKSAKKIRSIVVRREVAAVVSLFISSHGNGMGAFNYGFMYDIRPDRNRTPCYSRVERILRRAVRALPGELRDWYKDTLRPSRLRSWESYFTDTPFFGGEVAALGGYLGMTLATTGDGREFWNTPYDTPKRVDFPAARSQGRLALKLIRTMADEPGTLFEETPRLGIAELDGEAKFIRHGELFPEQPAPGTVIQAYQGPAVYYAMADTAGRFNFSGISDKKNTYHKMILEGYRFAPDSGDVLWAVDKKQTGKSNYRVKMNRRYMETDLVMFGARQITFFDLLEPRTFNYMTKIDMFDGRRDTVPMRYWFSRIDTRQSTMAALFVEPDTPVKFTLSDTLLTRKLILTNGNPDSPNGEGYLPGEQPEVLATEYAVAKDMWQLLKPRIRNLESHGVVNDRIGQLQQQGEQDLQDARTALQENKYSDFMERSRASWALAGRVYSDVESTQKDVLVGVLFYIALFVPFAYCLERVVFAFADIHKRIVGFLVILCAVIGVVYLVHPAFQLTYSPLVVILAFFIVGLSAMVSLIIFFRFEKEMQSLQRRSQHMKGSDISRWKAFTAAFVIGVSNLRRRPIRTVLTCVTLVILTFTIMSFTAVKSVRQSTDVLFSPNAPYKGILVKALGWNTLPPRAADILTNAFRNKATGSPRLWLETPDRTEAVHVPLIRDEHTATARGMIGLTAEDPLVLGNLQDTLTGGRWFRPGERNVCLLPHDIALRMGIDPTNPRGTVDIWGAPFTVVGCFDGQALDKVTDLDGEPLTPAIYPNETVVQMNEAEMEALESGDDVRSFQGRYQHVDGSRIAIAPADTVRAMGGEFKAMAVVPEKSNQVTPLARSLVDRFGLTLFAGTDKGTFVYQASDAINYSGVPNILVPLLIAVLIVLNTMIASVYERKKEISIYTSIGMAPTHVAYLFIAEAVAFAVISVVIGYLVAQSAAEVLAGTSLWAGMTANYSSLAGIAAMLLVILVTLISVIYPAKVAAGIAIPDVNRSWTMPTADGNEMVVTLPFLLRYHEQDCIGGFLFTYYEAHKDVSHGLFCSDDIGCSYACPAHKIHPASSTPTEEQPPCLNVKARIWLAPFDFGVKQTTELVFCPAQSAPSFLEIQVRIVRETGEKGMWRRINKNFLNDIRKQLLVWRSLNEDVKPAYEKVLKAHLGHHEDDEGSTMTPPIPRTTEDTTGAA